jgi:hypothetical protein
MYTAPEPLEYASSIRFRQARAIWALGVIAYDMVTNRARLPGSWTDPIRVPRHAVTWVDEIVRVISAIFRDADFVALIKGCLRWIVQNG